MKTLLIVGAGIYQVPLIEYASTVCRVIVAAPEISDYLKSIIDKYLVCDVTDREKVLSFAIAEKIDGVITDQTDIAVRTVAYVAEQMNLSGIGYETACLFTDKNLMREKMIQLGIKVLPYHFVSNVSDAISFFDTIGSKPVILKPVDNQGSRGVIVCKSKDEIINSFEESLSYSKSHSVIIEKFVTGREFVVESLCFNYQYVPLIWGDSHYFDIPNMFAPYERVFPSDVSETLKQKLLDLNEHIITGFGLKQGIAHSEYIMDGEDIYLIESAARGGGVFISSDLISISTGLHTEEFLVNIALGQQNNMPKIQHNIQACAYMAFLIPAGEIESVDGIEQVKSLPYIHRHLLDNIHVGQKTKVNCDKTSRYAVIVSAANLVQLHERMDYVRSLLQIKVKKDGEYQDIIFR